MPTTHGQPIDALIPDRAPVAVTLRGGKGHNRGTSWFALTDHDWPRVRDAFEKWLDLANFDTDGHQLRPLRTR